MNEFLSGIIVELVGFCLTSIVVYLIFDRREKKNSENLKKTVYVRLKNKIINPFIATSVENLRADVFRPSAFSNLLLNQPVADIVIKIESLQDEVLNSFKNKDTSASINARLEQWKILRSNDFLIILKLVIGHWNGKQWKKYNSLLESSLKKIRDLLDLYQSRLPSDFVCKLIEHENNVEEFTRMMQTFPELFCRVDEVKIPITSKFLSSRRSFQLILAERLQSIFAYLETLRVEVESQKN